MNRYAERILFIGRNTRYAITTSVFLNLLESIRSTPHKIVGVVHTHEDDCHYPNSLQRLAHEHNIKTVSFTNNDINASSSLSTLRSFQATLFLVVQYPRIFDTSVISLPSTACLNLHRGWPLRGGSIDQRAIYYKQTEYFVILHKINSGIDTGNILARERVAIDWRTETGYSLDAKVTEAGGKLIRNGFVSRLETNDFTGIRQNTSQTQYENKWKPDRKVICPQDITYGDAERLARSLYHPRENGLIVKMRSGDLYRWEYSDMATLMSVKWKDRIEAAPLIQLQ